MQQLLHVVIFDTYGENVSNIILLLLKINVYIVRNMSCIASTASGQFCYIWGNVSYF